MRHIKILLFCVCVCMAMGLHGRAPAQDKGDKPQPAAMPLQVRDFSALLGTPGLSDTLLANHFKLYQGYVKNTNTILEKLAALLADKKTGTPEYAELKRRLGWEWDGLLLHECYFENIGGKEPLAATSELYKKLEQSFGSVANWQQDFVSTGLMRGIGWVILYCEPRSGKLVNAWIGEHDSGHIAAAKPLLVMDVFEHAYMLDYQLDKAKYIETFIKTINWKVVNDRFAK